MPLLLDDEVSDADGSDGDRRERTPYSIATERATLEQPPQNEVIGNRRR